MRKLSKLQQDALRRIGRKWAPAPLGVKSATLLSLDERNLIEGRFNSKLRGVFLMMPYNSIAYEWRKVS